MAEREQKQRHTSRSDDSQVEDIACIDKLKFMCRKAARYMNLCGNVFSE